MAEANEKIALCLYFDADNDLEREILTNLMEVYKGDLSQGNIEIYVYLDRTGKLHEDFDAYLKTQGNNPWWDGEKFVNKACYLKIYYDTQIGKNVMSVAQDQDLGKQNSADPATLKDFLNWAKKESDKGSTPATKYLLDLSDHGKAFQCSFGDESARDSGMIPQQVADAIRSSNLKKIAVLIEDACLMASAEAESVMTGCVDFVVASEDMIGGNGLNYIPMISELAKLNTSAVTSQELAELIVEANDGETRKKKAVETLSAVRIDGSITEALNTFAESSSAFTDQDWIQLAKAFGNYSYLYLTQDSAVDLLEVLDDDELDDGKVSVSLQSALQTLEVAVQSAITKITMSTTTLGQGITVFSPLRVADTKTIPELYQYFGMTAAGNETDWNFFTQTLYRKAKDAGIVRVLAPDTKVNGFDTDSCIVPTETGSGSDLTVVNVSAKLLGPLSSDSMFFDNLQYTNVSEPQWYHFLTNWKEGVGAVSVLNFTFTSGTEDKVAAGDYVLSIYGFDAETEHYSTLVYQAKNEAKSNSISIDLTEKLKNNTGYCLQVYSPTSYGSYILRHDLSVKGEGISYFAYDRLDYFAKDEETHKPNNTSANAYTLSANYYSGMIVYSDHEGKSHSDWYKTDCYANCTISVCVTGGTEDLTYEPGLIVEQYIVDENGKETLVGTATGKRQKYTDIDNYFWEYKFDDFKCQDGQNYSYLKISTKSETAILNYDITVSNVQKKTYCEKILTTSLFKSDDTGASTLYWNAYFQSQDNTLRLTKDGFASALELSISTFTAHVYNNQETLDWQVGNPKNKNKEWIAGSEKISADTANQPRCVIASDDYITDILMARADGTWENGHCAFNEGFTGTAWKGTQEAVSITGKNKITDVFTGGGTDSAILVLTDDANGDAAFADSVHSALPEDADNGSRLTNITKVYAGAGDDVVDFTSQRYSCADNQKFVEMYLYGGDGNDVLWTANTASWLFGDAGNDKLSGSTKNDVLVGGSGDDIMYGCGGEEDIFCFCKEWGNDIVYQVAGSSVTLWFTEGDDDNWDEKTLTYTDGDYSVKVFGVTDDDIALRFGREQKYADDYDKLAATGAFLAESTSKIYVSTLA